MTGGDSGIGRAVAIGFAKEGADVAVTYLEEDADARHTKKLVERDWVLAGVVTVMAMAIPPLRSSSRTDALVQPFLSEGMRPPARTISI